MKVAVRCKRLRLKHRLQEPLCLFLLLFSSKRKTTRARLQIIIIVFILTKLLFQQIRAEVGEESFTHCFSYILQGIIQLEQLMVHG